MKSLAKDTAIYGLSSIAGRFLNWLLVPLYTNIFINQGAYGIVTNIYAYVAFAMVILTFGMETTFFRYVNKQEEKATTVYSTTLIAIAGLAILFLLNCFAFISPIASWMKYPNNHDFILIMAITVAFDAFTAIPFAYLRYKKRPIRFATIKLFGIFLNIALNLFFLVLCPTIYKTNPEIVDWFYNPNYGIGYIFVANLISSLCMFIALSPFFTGFKYIFDKDLFRRMLKYSYPLVILGIAGIMNQTVDKILYPFILGGDEGLKQLGIYSACSKIAVVMTMFTQAFRFAYEPFIFAQNKGEDNRHIYSMAMKYFVLFSLIVFLGVSYYLDILKYFVGSKYFEGIVVVPIVMLGEFFFGIYFNLSLWFKLTDKTYYGAYFSLLGCVIIILINIIFVPLYGYIASAWASMICYFIMMVVSYLFGQKYYPIKYDIKKLTTYFFLALGLYFIGTLPEIENEMVRMGYRTMLLILFLAIIVKKDIPLSQIPIVNKFIKTK